MNVENKKNYFPAVVLILALVIAIGSVVLWQLTLDESSSLLFLK